MNSSEQSNLIVLRVTEQSSHQKGGHDEWLVSGFVWTENRKQVDFPICRTFQTENKMAVRYTDP